MSANGAAARHGPAAISPILPLVARVLATALGASLLFLAGYCLVGLVLRLRDLGFASFSIRDAGVATGILALIFAGALLIALFRKPRPARNGARRHRPKANPVYGFGTILAIGIGSTLGSPLFLLIPLNVVQYEIVSILSLVLATLLSVAMARLYARNYRILRSDALAAVGGPAFVETAVGVRSARYFVSRLSMAIANTALAAYCMIVFVLFDFEVLPALLQEAGAPGVLAWAVACVVAALFGLWFVMNSILERRFLRTIGRAQVVFTSVLLAILVGQSYLLGSSGGWRLTGLLAFPASSDLGWLAALVVNTAYLYLLFFGFQEIQSLEQEALSVSRIPVLSRLFHWKPFDKRAYLGYAMIVSVVIAAAVNIFYALAVYAASPDPASLATAQIPALYVSETCLGTSEALFTALAFMIATFTTFVPAFMAASRHIGALGDDGFLPKGVGRVSWVLVLVAIVFLAVMGEAFLVSITDFMVLVSLGFIALSAAWLRRTRRKTIEKPDLLPLGVALSCYLAAAALYAITPSVAVFGSLSIAVAFLIYDVLELGVQGSRLFVALLCMMTYVLLVLYPAPISSPGLLPFASVEAAIRDAVLLRDGLLLGAGGLLLTFLLDAVLRRMGSDDSAATRPEA